ncbi:MAG TPA: arginase family protein [Solirubrobacterales bacterium]|nr:arginase family protein [Aestuariivirgaceae bacterium]HKZ15758.1 arginase family protein [Solirubrobacterales bacterium]
MTSTVQSSSSGPLRLIGVPYHLGQRDISMGMGPGVLFGDDNLPATLRSEGTPFELCWVDADEPAEGDRLVPGDQMSRQLVHNRRIAELVGEADEAGSMPILASGNCNSSIGVISGLSDPAVGIVWFDAHADADTPSESPSGLFDGMAVATVAGLCWQAWAAEIPGFQAVDESRMVMVGMHACGQASGERKIRDEGQPLGNVVDRPVIDQAGGITQALGAALDQLAANGVERIYLHIDLDVLAEEEGRSSLYTAPGGLKVQEVIEGIDTVFGRLPVAAVTFSAYDPEVDPRMREIAPRIVRAVFTAHGERG